MYMAISSLTYILGSSVKFFYQPICTYYENEAYFDKKITLQSYPLKPLNQIKPIQAGVIPFQNCVGQPCLLVKMADVTENIDFFNGLLLFYYK